MFGFGDKDIYVRRPEPNRRRRISSQPILMVNARLAEQRRERLHRVGAVLTTLIALAGLGWLIVSGGQWLGRRLFTENPRYTVKHLLFELSAGTQLPADRLREYSKLREGVNLFAVDLRAVVSDLMKVPLVSQVRVTRRLPDTLIVRVAERVALARLGQDDQRYHLAVDREGRVLGPSARSPNLPALIGLRDRALRPGDEIQDPGVLTALQILDRCDTTRVGQVVKIKSIDLRHPDHLVLRLSQGELIDFGPEQWDVRLGRLARAVQEAADVGKVIDYADFTVDKNMAVRFRP
jgi:cell division protein FtsQ